MVLAGWMLLMLVEVTPHQAPGLGPPLLGPGAGGQPAPVSPLEGSPGLSPVPAGSPLYPLVPVPGQPGPLDSTVPGATPPPGYSPPPLFAAPSGPDPSVPPWIKPRVEPAWQQLGPDGKMWFGVDVGIVYPAVGQHLQGTVTYPTGVQVPVIVPQAPLDWTAMPTLQLGYHSPENRGDYAILWRMVASSGQAPFVVNNLPTTTTSELSLNVVDLDYISPNLSALPRWYMGYTLGARYGGVFIQSISQGSLIYRKASSNFPGGGPHLRGDFSRQVALLPGLYMVGSLDFAVLVGNVSQSFAASNYVNGAWEAGGYETSMTVTAPVLRADLGVTYRPPGAERMSFHVGYVFEQWWNVGTIDNSTADLYYQGVLLRFGLDF